MARYFLLLAAVLVMTLNLFSVPVFASPCPAMNGKTVMDLATMDMSEMPCHDNLADCISADGCALMTAGPLFVLTSYTHPYIISAKQEIDLGDYNVLSQHIAPPKRPPRRIS